MTNYSSNKTGWGHPPVDHRFRKGQSGNPRGRPRRSKCVDDAILKVLNRKVRFGDKRIAIGEALIVKLRHETLAGNPRAMKLAAQIISTGDQLIPPPPDKKQQEKDRQWVLDKLDLYRERNKGKNVNDQEL